MYNNYWNLKYLLINIINRENNILKTICVHFKPVKHIYEFYEY